MRDYSVATKIIIILFVCEKIFSVKILNGNIVKSTQMKFDKLFPYIIFQIKKMNQSLILPTPNIFKVFC